MTRSRKSRLQRIDDKFDAASAAYPRPGTSAPLDVTLRLAAHVPVLGSLAGVVVEAREYFSTKAINERLEALIAALDDEVNENSDQIADLKLRIDSPPFSEAFREASAQALFATQPAKITRFGAVLGTALGASDWPEIAGDLASFIRTLAQLTDRDLGALRLLHTIFADVLSVYPNMHDPNPFTEKSQTLLKAAMESGFHRDDFYAHCRRLEGFGLAMEVPRNTSRMAPGDYCFRPTRPGLKLLMLLKGGA